MTRQRLTNVNFVNYNYFIKETLQNWIVVINNMGVVT